MNIIKTLLKISSYIKIAQMLPFGFIPKKDFGPFKGGKIYIGLMPVHEIREDLDYSRADILDNISPQELKGYLKKPIAKGDLIFNFIDPTEDTDFWGYRSTFDSLNQEGILLKAKEGVNPYSLKEIANTFATDGETFKLLGGGNINLSEIKAVLQREKPIKTEISPKPSPTMLPTQQEVETWPGTTMYGDIPIDISEIAPEEEIPKAELEKIKQQVLPEEPESSIELAEMMGEEIPEEELAKFKKEPKKLFALGKKFLEEEIFNNVYGMLALLNRDVFEDPLDLLALDFISVFKDLNKLKKLEPQEQRRLHPAFHQILKGLEERVTGPQREGLLELADNAYILAGELLKLIGQEYRNIFVSGKAASQLKRIASILLPHAEKKPIKKFMPSL